MCNFCNYRGFRRSTGKGNYISQLCSLQLGNYLHTNGYVNHGWDGAWGGEIYNRLFHFGLVTKSTQKAVGCGGLTEYPAYGAAPRTEMDIESHHALSEMIDYNVRWFSILDGVEAFEDRVNTRETLAIF